MFPSGAQTVPPDVSAALWSDYHRANFRQLPTSDLEKLYSRFKVRAPQADSLPVSRPTEDSPPPKCIHQNAIVRSGNSSLGGKGSGKFKGSSIPFRELRLDPLWLLNQLEERPFIFRSAPPSLQRDFHFALQAVLRNGLSLEHMANDFKSDKQIILAAIQQNFHARDFVPPDLLLDKQIISAIKESIRIFKGPPLSLGFHTLVSQLIPKFSACRYILAGNLLLHHSQHFQFPPTLLPSIRWSSPRHMLDCVAFNCSSTRLAESPVPMSSSFDNIERFRATDRDYTSSTLTNGSVNVELYCLDGSSQLYTVEPQFTIRDLKACVTNRRGTDIASIVLLLMSADAGLESEEPPDEALISYYCSNRSMLRLTLLVLPYRGACQQLRTGTESESTRIALETLINSPTKDAIIIDAAYQCLRITEWDNSLIELVLHLLQRQLPKDEACILFATCLIATGDDLSKNIFSIAIDALTSQIEPRAVEHVLLQHARSLQLKDCHRDDSTLSPDRNERQHQNQQFRNILEEGLIPQFLVKIKDCCCEATMSDAGESA